MARFQKSKTQSPRLGLLLVVGVFIVGAIVYIGFVRGGFSLDFRSKAAEEVKTVKQWDFVTDGTFDGWSGTNIVSSQVRKGVLTGTVGVQKTIPAFTNSTLGFDARELSQYAFTNISVKVRLAVTAAQGCGGSQTQVVVPGAPTRKPCPTTAPFAFPFELVIRGRNEPSNSPSSTTGTADGQMHEYEFILPRGMMLSSITSMALRFIGLSNRGGTTISIDSITVISRRTIQPTPSPIVRTEVTKVGTVERDRLEGTSGYFLRVPSENKSYRLVAFMNPDQRVGERLEGNGSGTAQDASIWTRVGSTRQGDNRSGDTRRQDSQGMNMRNLFESFVGISVRVKGYLTAEKSTSWFGIPRSGQSIIQVTSIEKAP